MSEVNDLFVEDNIPESNFFKFAKIGDQAGGTLVEISESPAKGIFGPQRVFTLKQPDGSFVKVGIAHSKQYVIERAARANLGDMLGFKFMKEIPNATPGLAAAKSIEVFIKHVSVQANTDVAGTEVPFQG